MAFDNDGQRAPRAARMKSDPGVGAQLPLQGGRLIAQTTAKGRETT